MGFYLGQTGNGGKCWRFVRMVYQFDAKGQLMNGVQKLFILKTLTTYLERL